MVFPDGPYIHILHILTRYVYIYIYISIYAYIYFCGIHLYSIDLYYSRTEKTVFLVIIRDPKE